MTKQSTPSDQKQAAFRSGQWPLLSNTQAPIQWRHACDVTRTWPEIWVTSPTYRPKGLRATKKPWCWGSSPQTISQSAWHNTKLEELSLQHLSWIPTDLYVGLKSANKIQCLEWTGLSWSFKHEITWSWEIPLEFIWISLTIMPKCCSSWMVSAWQ